MVSIAAFQAVDPGSIPGRRTNRYFVVRFCYHRTIPMMRFAAYYGFHYWSQFELVANNGGRNLPRVVPV
jgi:hypothetical protein